MGRVLQEIAEPDVEFAQQLAPKRTGAGARSIHVEAVLDGDMWEARASWDQEHYYMRFHEMGTRKMGAHPFLRPAFMR